MLSTNNPTLDFYNNIVSNPQLLADGYTLISNYLHQKQQHRRDTLLNLLHPQVPILSLIINLYPLEIFSSPTIDDSEKESTVQFLLNLLVEELLKPSQQLRSKEINLLLELMHKIHNSQGFDRWIGLYLQALSKLAEQNSSKFGYCLINILKNADDRVSALSEQLISKLISYKFCLNEQKLQIYYYLLKSLSFRVDTDPQTINSQVRPHLQSILNCATANMKQSARCLKFSLKIMTLIFGDYGEACPSQLIKQIQTTSQYLIVQYINFLNTSSDFEKGQEEDQEDQQPIEVALYQILELFMTLFGTKAKLDIQKVLYLCIISTYLGQHQYKKYLHFSDQYLMDVEDEGETNIRNKSTYFINELIDHDKYNKKSIQFLKQYTIQILLHHQTIESKVKEFLKKHRLPEQVIKIPEVYIQSALFIMHSFTDQLVQDKMSQISAALLNELKISPSDSIDSVLSILILNKCARNGNENQKQFYLNLLRSLIQKFSNNIGVLVAISRGIYQYASINDLSISNSMQSGIPMILVNNLSEYLLRDDSAQQESAYLILQFYIHLLKCTNNQSLLQQIIPFQKEVYYLKKFLHTGMTSKVMIDFSSKLANPITLNMIFKEIENGFAKDQNLSEIIGACLKSKAINLTEHQIIRLCQVYSGKLDLISNIVSSYLDANPVQNQELICFLSKSNKSEWIPGLLKQGKLKNIEQHFVQSVKSITNELDSLEQIQNQLVVPYFALLNNTDNAISLLNNQNILVNFFEKLYRYAGVFQGTHLKIITAHVFISLAEKIHDLTPKVVQLIKSYGNIESSQWEDEEDQLGQMGENLEMTEGLIERMMNRIVNEKVEQTFKTVFGQLSWDSKRLYDRLARLQAHL